MAKLPASGIISSSQVGVYVFDRTSTQEFSLSASLAGTTVNKGYTTTLGPLWRGSSNVGDTNNQQYNQGANNFSLSDWYSYAKGVSLSVTPYTRCDGICDELTEAVAYATDGTYWGGGTEDTIVVGLTVGYSNTSGTTILTATADGDCIRQYGFPTIYTIDPDGIFQNYGPECPP
jgi:hypothetical protein